MKKILSVILVIALIAITLSSCDFGGGGDDTTTKSTEQENTEKAQINTLLTTAKTKMNDKNISFSATLDVKDGANTKSYRIESAKVKDDTKDDFMFTVTEVKDTDPYEAGIYVIGNIAYVATPIGNIKTTIDREELKTLNTTVDNFITKVSAYLKAYATAIGTEADKNANSALATDFENILKAIENFSVEYMASPSVTTSNNKTSLSFELSQEFMKKLETSKDALDATITTEATVYPKVKLDIDIDANGYVSTVKVVKDGDEGFTLNLNVNIVGDGVAVNPPTNLTKYKDVSLGESAREGIYNNIDKALKKIKASTSTTVTTTVSFGATVAGTPLPSTFEIVAQINGEDMIIDISANDDYSTEACKLVLKGDTLYGRVGSKRYSVSIVGNEPTNATELTLEQENSYKALEKYQITSIMKMLDTISLRPSGTGTTGVMNIGATKAQTIAKLLTQMTGTYTELGTISLNTNFDANGYLTSLTFNTDAKANINLDAGTVFALDGIRVNTEVQINEGATVTVSKPSGTFTSVDTLEEFANKIISATFGIEAQQ